MRRISSKMTWWYKKAIPFIWFAVLAVASLFVIAGVIQRKYQWDALMFLLAAAILGYALCRRLAFPLVDEVWIVDDDIIVRNDLEEVRFPISNVIKVVSRRWDPEQIVLTLKEPCRFGRVITFSPPERRWQFRRNPIAKELMHRVHQTLDKRSNMTV